MAHFSLAINSRYTGTASGKLKEPASWHNLVVNGSILTTYIIYSRCVTMQMN
jgi:hypothetical protein